MVLSVVCGLLVFAGVVFLSVVVCCFLAVVCNVLLVGCCLLLAMCCY